MKREDFFLFFPQMLELDEREMIYWQEKKKNEKTNQANKWKRDAYIV